MLKIVASDTDAEEKLDRISLKADELAAKHPELKPKVDIAEASAKLAVLRAELKDTAKASDDTSGRLSLFQRVLDKLSGSSPGGGGILSALNGAGTAGVPLVGNVYGLVAA